MLSPLLGGLQQFVPGHKPAYREALINAEVLELSLKLAQLPGKKTGKNSNTAKVTFLLINARGGLTSPV